MKNRSLLHYGVFFSFLTFLCGTGPLLGQRLYPMTPYTQAPTQEEVAFHRSSSDRSRWIRDFKPSSTAQSVTAYSLRIAYALPAKIPSVRSTMLKGIDRGTSVSIRLGDIEQLTVVARDTKQVTIAVVTFSGLDESKLLTALPSYTVLKTDYRKTVTVQVELKGGSGADLCLLGQNNSDDSDERLGPRILFRDVELNKPIVLRYLAPEIWWATSSVFHDPSYPYTDTKSTNTYSDPSVAR